jgi:hypothetical protein
MGSITTTGCALVLGVPLVFAAATVHAQTQPQQNNGALGAVQKFLGGNNDNSDQQRAYEQGRRDEMHRQQADQNYRSRDYNQRYDNNPSDRGTGNYTNNNGPNRY